MNQTQTLADAGRSVIGVIGITERLAKEAEQENTSIYFSQLFDRLLAKQHTIFDAYIVSYKPLNRDE